MAKRDPRRTITPDAFKLSPDLLGIVLARPSRRLVAIAIDGLLIAVLSHIGGRMLLALGAGVMLWRASARPSVESQANRSLVRNALRFASVIAIFIFALAAYNFVKGRAAKVEQSIAGTAADSAARTAAAHDTAKDTAKDTANAATSDSDTEVDLSNIDLSTLGLHFSDAHWLKTMGAMGKASDSATAAPHADSLAAWLETRPDTARRRIAAMIMAGFENSENAGAVRASFAKYLPADGTTSADTLVRANARLRRENAALARENKTLAKEEKSAKEGFTKRLLTGMSDVLGFGFGWSALYFTAFTLWMRGQTPGKKLLGLRVIRLDGKPITGWMSFERFGGYAASAATGLLGFAQIIWDENRQALHDKVAETVVIREQNGVPLRE